MKLQTSNLLLKPMLLGDIEQVRAIELSVYTHPWSFGNFADALNQSYDAWVAKSADGMIAGYFVQMQVIDEAHLLTIAVHRSFQRQGVGLALLRHLKIRAAEMNMASILLEVRVSNLRAIAVYDAFGFVKVGQRKSYYPTLEGPREDALILRFEATK